MHPTWLAQLGKKRPLLVANQAGAGRTIAGDVAPITRTVHGPRTEVALGEHIGIAHDAVDNLDSITTSSRDLLYIRWDHYRKTTRTELALALHEAFHLED